MPESDISQLAERKPSNFHVAFSKWATETTGQKLSPQAAALTLRLQSHFRRTEEYAEIHNSAAQAREQVKAEQVARRQQRIATRLAKLRETQAKLEARLHEHDTAPAEAEEAEKAAPAEEAEKAAPAAKPRGAARKAARAKNDAPAKITRGKASATPPLPDEDDVF